MNTETKARAVEAALVMHGFDKWVFGQREGEPFVRTRCGLILSPTASNVSALMRSRVTCPGCLEASRLAREGRS